MKDKIKRWYNQGLWTETMVRQAVVKNVITLEDFKDITGKEY